jgi:hypothetical protein
VIFFIVIDILFDVFKRSKKQEARGKKQEARSKKQEARD